MKSTSFGSPISPEGSSLRQFRQSLTRDDWRSLSGMFGFILFLHVLGFGILFGFVLPQDYRIGGDHPIFTVGVGVLAYTFGLRHAFDADHIAAVDNTTRKLMADNRASGVDNKPLSVGFWLLPGALDRRVHARLPALGGCQSTGRACGG